MKRHIKRAVPEGLPLQLAEARRAKGLTQLRLAQRLGVPQSYLSTVESGKVDARLSTLTELSRVLELELLLVPRSLVPIVKKILGSGTRQEREESSWLYRLSE